MHDSSYGTRRHLPHMERPDATYFVTFATLTREVLAPVCRDLVLATCVAEDGVSSYLHAAVVMPDHVHLILQPYPQFRLPQVMQRIKGVSAHRVNHMLGRRGSLWTEESFDRIVRLGESIREKSEYVCENPVRAGLVAVADEYRWLWRAWARAGGAACPPL